MLLKKELTDKHIYNAARLLKKYKIPFRTYNMFGLPDETLEDAFKTVELNIKIKTDYPWSSLFQPFPGTKLSEYVQRNYNIAENMNKFEPSFFKKSGLRLPEKRKIENLHKLFFYAVKFPFMLPLIKKMIRTNYDIFYDLLFLIGYAWSFKKSEGILWRETFYMGIGNVKNLFFKKNI